jgi:hypothetical protein
MNISISISHWGNRTTEIQMSLETESTQLFPGFSVFGVYSRRKPYSDDYSNSKCLIRTPHALASLIRKHSCSGEDVQQPLGQGLGKYFCMRFRRLSPTGLTRETWLSYKFFGWRLLIVCGEPGDVMLRLLSGGGRRTMVYRDKGSQHQGDKAEILYSNSCDTIYTIVWLENVWTSRGHLSLGLKIVAHLDRHISINTKPLTCLDKRDLTGLLDIDVRF